MTDTSMGSAVVIEDDEDIRLLISTVLEQRGLQVRSAASGRAGLALVEEHQPDLVTLDLGLPDIEGFEVCRRLRTISDAYVVMVSASADEVDQLLSLETGADDYITKPFSPRDLKARVGAMLRRPRQWPGPALSSRGMPRRRTPPGGRVPTGRSRPFPPGPAPRRRRDVATTRRMTVDLEGREVVLDGVELALTRIEFDLLAAFASTRGGSGAARPCCAASGRPSGPRTRTWSRCTWATCAASSARTRGSAPCAGWATGSTRSSVTVTG